MNDYYVIYITPEGKTVDIIDTGSSAVEVADRHRPHSNGTISCCPVTQAR